MHKETHTTLPQTPSEIFKTVFSFIGKSILILFGILEGVSVFWGAFELSLSFLEISVMEMLFFVVFYFLIKRHIDAAKNYKLAWKQALYLPLRNLGWFGILFALPLMVILIKQESYTVLFKYEKLLQLIEYTGVSICLYLASPAKDKNKTIDMAEDASVKVDK